MMRLLFAVCVVFALAGAGTGAAAVHAETRTVQFHAGDNAPPLDCPARPAPQAYAPPAFSPHIPTREDLGQLAIPRIRDQPSLHVPEFERLASRDISPEHPLRIALWGDSHIAAGPFAETLRGRIRTLGYRPVTGFVPASMGRANVRLGAPLRAYCLGEGWSSDLAFKAAGPVGVGPSLMTRDASAGAESWLAVDFRAADASPLKSVSLVYSATRGATLGLSANGALEQAVALPPSSRSEMIRIRTDASVGTLSLRVLSGDLALHGFRLEDSDPAAVTLDVFGLPSSTVAGWANAEPQFLRQTMGAGAYDAVVLEYGTNEGAESGFDIPAYSRTLRLALTNLRAALPRAACVLMGPPDRGRLLDGASRSVDLMAPSANPSAIASAQREIAPEFGCAFWDWDAFMGGPGGAYGWAYAEPPLMARDLTHLTPEGYRLTAEALAKSLGF